ncbi:MULTISPECIES: transporter substrate-binding domain-containing protein [Tsukamurella]|uniref:Transporter substrate-binding domain-containing protein n=2 Tax=Tsukamurella TaxID=2060 RepID=A0A5C5S207_9ACTN|nr:MULTISPECIES: transporter substrate-binding domain-containing protein [Tsukamurella]NMD56153.1 transporter substrate-binding domain-containing protein [Tsukamurella columbiensis]TWS28750.1 transporter substrate-binding domain-containing protein [Tsukamurella conjunctivitidis]
MPSRPRASAAVALVTVLMAALCACSGPSPRSLLRSIDDGAVILGVKADQPGLGLRGAGGDYAGFDIDIARYVVRTVAASRGKPEPRITWRESPTPQRERLIDNGEVDAIVASYSIDAARAAAVTFAGPYLTTRQGLLVRGDESAVGTVSDLGRDRTLCAVTGSTSARTVAALLPGVRLIEYDSYSACADALARRAVDAFTTDEVILAGFAAQRPNAFRLVDMLVPRDTCVDGRLRTAGAPLSVERYGVGLAHGDDAARDAVNAALRSMLASGEWERALRRAVGDEEAGRTVERDGGPDRLVDGIGDLGFLAATSAPCAAR